MDYELRALLCMFISVSPAAWHSPLKATNTSRISIALSGDASKGCSSRWDGHWATI